MNLEFMWDELDKSGFVVLSVFLFLFDEREANEHYVSHGCLVCVCNSLGHPKLIIEIKGGDGRNKVRQDLPCVSQT